MLFPLQRGRKLLLPHFTMTLGEVDFCSPFRRGTKGDEFVESKKVIKSESHTYFKQLKA
jgi:hypothetical protein